MTQSTLSSDDGKAPAEATPGRIDAIEALDLGREQLKGIIDALPVLVAYVGADGRYRFASKGYEQWFGESRSQIVGKHVREVLGETAFQAIQSHLEAALAGQEVTFESFVPYTRGSRTVNRVPASTDERTSMEPPCAAMMRSAM